MQQQQQQYSKNPNSSHYTNLNNFIGGLNQPGNIIKTQENQENLQYSEVFNNQVIREITEKPTEQNHLF